MTNDLVVRLHDYKSLLVPLFMVSEGGLKDKAKSFNIADITHKQSELFLACWEHNLDWGNTFLKEYFVTKAGFGRGYGIKLVFSYALKQAKNLLKTCKEEYDCDLPAMIRDAREGKFPVSMPIKMATKLMSIRGNGVKASEAV
jgi:hypothetical protein